MERCGSGSHRARIPGFGLFALVMGCAIQPPELPDGVATLGGTVGGAGEAGTSDSDAGPQADGTTGGPTPGGGPVATDGLNETGGSDGASEETGLLTAGSTTTGAGAESTGAAQPWYVGTYTGTWDGDCDGQIPLSGEGSWTVDVYDDGEISGSYQGTLSSQLGNENVGGQIDGSVTPEGNATATATGPELGECNWDGLIEGNGDAQGDLDCSLGCSGQWSGSKS